jgi:hypothetical protein
MTDGGVVVNFGSPASIYGEEPMGPTFAVPDGFDIFFRATIAYRGPFSTEHETSALWLYMPGSFEFVIRGGDEYNYVR